MNTNVLVGICTYRRDTLGATLASLAGLDLPENVDLSVVIADNDTTPVARTRVTEHARTLPFRVDYLHAPERNISVARNAILDHAEQVDPQFLAFIDDDETVTPGWLKALLACHEDTGCGAVIGPVRADYGPGAPEWMRHGNVHDTEPDIDTEARAHTGYTCNLLLDRSDARLRALRFDLDRGQSGGEDTAYFARYLKAGGQIGFAPAAVVRETVPEDRARLSWLLRRRYRMGQTHGGLICEGLGLAGIIRQSVLATAKAGYCLITAASPDALKRNRALMRGALHVGAISGCLGGQHLQIYGAPGTAPAPTTDKG